MLRPSSRGELPLETDPSLAGAVSRASSISDTLLKELARTLGQGSTPPDPEAVRRVLRSMAHEARTRNVAYEQLAASLETVFTSVVHARRLRWDLGEGEVDALRELTELCIREYYRSAPADR